MTELVPFSPRLPDDAPEGVGDETWHGWREQQLVRMDGTVLVSFLVAPGQRLWFELPPWQQFTDPCVGRVRALPEGEWFVLAYFPEGWPGPRGEFPEAPELPGESRALGPGR